MPVGASPQSDETAPRPTRVRWLVFALACAASWLLYLHRYAWGVVRPSLKAEDPELTDLDLGWLDSLFNLTYALGQVPGGLAGDLRGVGPSGDVDSLGAILSEMHPARPPFRSDNPVNTLSLVLNSAPERPRAVNASVPRDLETIALKCLEKEPGKRYASAEALATDLRRFLDGRAIL